MPPILAPVIRKIRIMAAELAPIERKTAMSAFFDLTNIIIDETILKAATNMISVRIRNITFRSTCSALIKVGFFLASQTDDMTGQDELLQQLRRVQSVRATGIQLNASNSVRQSKK